MFVQLAEEYRKAGLLENAVEICEQGLKNHPQYPSARVALGRALLESESFGRAAEEFETVLAQVPDNILANKFLGETYHRMGRFEEALQKYQIAQTLAPDDTELEGKIQSARNESAGKAPAPPAPDAAPPPSDASTAAAASELSQPPAPELPQPPPLFDREASAGSLPEPPPMPSEGDGLEATFVEPPGSGDGLEATFVDPPAASAPPLPEAPPPEPPTETFFEGASMLPKEPEAESEPEPDPEPDVAPIPLVDVSEPMVLEGSAYIAAENAAERSEREPPPPTPAVEPSEAAPEGEQVFDVSEDEPPTAPDAPFVQGPLEGAPEPESNASAPGPADDVAISQSPVVDEIETPTMAELYASQGHFDRAVAVYRNLLARNPNETQYRDRIEELKMLANAAALPETAVPRALSPEAVGDGLTDESRTKTIGVLSSWLEAIRKSREA